MQLKAIIAGGAALLLLSGVLALERRGMSPLEMEAACGMARLHMEQGEHDKAVALYEELLRRSRGAAYVRLGLASALCRKGEWREAESHYRVLLAEDPESPVALFDLGQCLLAQGRRSEGRVALARFAELHGGSFPELALRAAAATADAR